MGNRIHPTALVDASAVLGDEVAVGPHAIIEPDVTVGDGCRVLAGAVIRRYTTLGPRNLVHPYAVLGGEPQDYKFNPDNRTYLRIGSGNIFREHVTISRATREGGATVIGSDCFFMAAAHVGHDSVVADQVILTNGAAAAGHVEIGRGTILSAHSGVHQFCWVGELVMTRGNSGASQHVPPFVVLRDINVVAGLNVVGMRRADWLTEPDRRQIKEAFRLLYRSGLPTGKALAEMDAHTEWGAPAGRFRDFVRRAVAAVKPYNRGLVRGQAGRRDSADEGE